MSFKNVTDLSVGHGPAFSFDASIAVSEYDFLYHDANDVKPASSQTDQTTLVENQAKFASNFAGLAGFSALSTDTTARTLEKVLTDVIADVTCASSAWEVGDLIGIDEADSGTALHNSRVQKVTDPALAIGYCVEREGSAVTNVKGRFVSRVVPPAVAPLTPTAYSVTPNSGGESASQIPAGATRVSVGAVTTDANDFIVLPALADVPDGFEITVLCNAGTAFEIRTPATSGEKINTVDSDGTQELAAVDTEVIKITKVSTTDGWIARSFTALGADNTALIPD